MTRNRIIAALFAFSISIAAVAGIAVHWAAAEIATPPRRPLEDFHRKLMAEQEGSCLRIDRFTASDGTPCLVVHPQGGPAERGNILRDQLKRRGYSLANYGEVSGTLVLIHGRKGRKEDYLAVAERFCAAGFRCIIPDLPAHGDHPGETATYGLREAGLPERMLREAAELYHFDPHPAGLMGLSMGGSVAVHAAARDGAPWRALAVVASFDALGSSLDFQAAQIAGETIGPAWISATDLLIRRRTGVSVHDIQPCRLAPKIVIPTLIAHGTHDEAVPLASARRLFDALSMSTPKQWVELPGAGHDNVLITDFPLYATIAAWMLDVLAPRATQSMGGN